MISRKEYADILTKIDKINSDPLRDEGLKVFEIQLIITKFREKQMALTVPTIKEIVASACDLPTDSLGSLTRKAEIKNTRQLAMWFYFKYTKMKLSAIGAEFSSGDHKFAHCTVIHSVKIINKLLEVDRRLNEQVASITKDIEVYYVKNSLNIKSITI